MTVFVDKRARTCVLCGDSEITHCENEIENCHRQSNGVPKELWWDIFY